MDIKVETHGGAANSFAYLARLKQVLQTTNYANFAATIDLFNKNNQAAKHQEHELSHYKGKCQRLENQVKELKQLNDAMKFDLEEYKLEYEQRTNRVKNLKTQRLERKDRNRNFIDKDEKIYELECEIDDLYDRAEAAEEDAAYAWDEVYFYEQELEKYSWKLTASKEKIEKAKVYKSFEFRK